MATIAEQREAERRARDDAAKQRATAEMRRILANAGPPTNLNARSRHLRHDQTAFEPPRPVDELAPIEAYEGIEP